MQNILYGVTAVLQSYQGTSSKKDAKLTPFTYCLDCHYLTALSLSPCRPSFAVAYIASALHCLESGSGISYLNDKYDMTNIKYDKRDMMNIYHQHMLQIFLQQLLTVCHVEKVRHGRIKGKVCNLALLSCAKAPFQPSKYFNGLLFYSKPAPINDKCVSFQHGL